MPAHTDTRIYFVRHAQPDLMVRDDRARPLTAQGTAAAERVARSLLGRSITGVYSSPFRRAVLTVEPLARELGLAVQLREDLREREIGAWVQDFRAFSRRQWADFDYRLPGGESLRQAQTRNVLVAQALLSENPGKSIVVGTHGAALSLILNYYDPAFGLQGFEAIVDRMPWAIMCQFHGASMSDRREIDVG